MPAGEGGTVVAYVDGEPAGSGGVTIADGVARLWGGVVAPAWRGRGVYRAVLDARLSYGVTHGTTMALVKGNVATSGPILRKAGFTDFGLESVYAVPLGWARAAGSVPSPVAKSPGNRFRQPASG